jgi:hypothetical protein
MMLSKQNGNMLKFISISNVVEIAKKMSQERH